MPTPPRKLKPFSLEHFQRYAENIVLDNGDYWQLEDFQCEILEPILAGVTETWVVIPEGNGKGLPLSSVLPTPSGWTTMGDLEVGDQLLGSNGLPTRVTFISEVMFKDCYKLTFSDGAEQVCTHDHLWWVEDAQDHYKGSVRTTAYLASRPLRLVKKGKSGYSETARWRVPVGRRRASPPVSLPVSPYVLGSWLTNGDNGNGVITSPFEEVWTRIETLGYHLGKPQKCRGARRATVLGLMTNLRKMGVLNNKHIPSDYLVSPEAQRWELLQGLMDGDGTVSKAGQATYSSSCRRLAEDVRRLVWSLGLPCSFNEKRAKLDGVDYGPTWELTISCDRRYPVVTVPFRADRLKANGKTTEHRRIVDIQRVPTVPAKCIQVDAPDHLFLCGESYIPTHNTSLMAGVALYFCDWQMNPWIPIAASSRDQAEILAQQAYQMIRASPGMRNRFKIYEGYRKILPIRSDHPGPGTRGIKVYPADVACLPVDEPVLTPTGWVPIGDLQVGDKVCDPEGGVARVEGVFPRGHEQVYRVTLADGSSVRATGDHQWVVGVKQRRPFWRTLTTDQIAHYRESGTRVQVPTIAPQEFEGGTVTVDPYLMGLLLGDGATIRTPVRLTSADRELHERAAALVPPQIYTSVSEKPANAASDLYFSGITQRHANGQFATGTNPLTEQLRALGVYGCNTYNKFVPEAYKWSSVEDRLALLQGLMDTDGTIDRRGRIGFRVTSKSLAYDFQFVLRSLGGRARMWSYLPKQSKDGYTRRRVYCLDNIQLPGMSLFRLERKKRLERVREQRRQWSIKSIEPDGTADVVCIKVSSPSHLYVTKDFIPTHNSGDGVIPTLALCDEGHRWPDLRLYRLWKGKLNKRKGQIVMISTAGEPGGDFESSRDAIRAQLPERVDQGAHLIARGPRMVMHEWSVRDSGEVTNMEKVKEANPLSIITEETLTKEFASPMTDLGDWRRLKCNQPTRTVNAAITEKEWGGALHPTLSTIPEASTILVGCDVAWKHDTFAIVPLWVDDEANRLLGKSFILEPPRDGSSMHPDEPKAAFWKLAEQFELETVVIDMERAEDIAAWIEDELGITVIDRPQGNANACQDYDAFMEALRNGKLKHVGDQGLTAHALNAIARALPGDKKRFDRPSQSRARKKQNVRVIDALTAAAMVNQYVDGYIDTSEPLVAWS